MSFSEQMLDQLSAGQLDDAKKHLLVHYGMMMMTCFIA